jgi:hypothetical protein
MEITRNSDRLDAEHADQEGIGRCVVFRMKYWKFANLDVPIGALSGDPQANQIFQKLDLKVTSHSISIHMTRIFPSSGSLLAAKPPCADRFEKDMQSISNVPAFLVHTFHLWLLCQSFSSFSACIIVATS